MKPRSNKIIMVGPDIDGLGGISKVVKTWDNNSFFLAHDILYLSSTTSAGRNKFLYLLGVLVKFIRLNRDSFLTYIHTSSGKSFYRKALFMLISILFRKEILLHIHPTHFYQFLLSSKGLKKTFIFHMLKRVDCFVVLTEQMKTSISGLFPDKKIFVLANPISMERMAKRVDSTRMERNLLFLGWFIKEKGIYDLVDAVEILLHKNQDVYLDFYGTKDIEKLQNYVANKHLDNRITVNDYIYEDRVIDELYKHTALVLPSYSEGIPNVILEAMATRTPIIATAVEGLNQILRDDVNCIIAEVANPVDLSAKILKCLNDKVLRERIAETAYHEACDKFDLGKIRTGFDAIMAEISADNAVGASIYKQHI